MATYTKDVLGNDLAPQRRADTGSPSSTFIQNVIDFAQRPLAFGTADKAEVAKIPAGSFVKNVFLEIITPEGSAINVDIGDTGSAAGYIAATSANAAAGTRVQAAGALLYTTLFYLGPKYYAAADSIYLAPKSGTLANGKVRVTVELATV